MPSPNMYLSVSLSSGRCWSSPHWSRTTQRKTLVNYSRVTYILLIRVASNVKPSKYRADIVLKIRMRKMPSILTSIASNPVSLNYRIIMHRTVVPLKKGQTWGKTIIDASEVTCIYHLNITFLLPLLFSNPAIIA